MELGGVVADCVVVGVVLLGVADLDGCCCDRVELVGMTTVDFEHY